MQIRTQRMKPGCLGQLAGHNDGRWRLLLPFPSMPKW